MSRHQRLLDALYLIIGSAVGASASAAFVIHRFLRGHLGDPSEGTANPAVPVMRAKLGDPSQARAHGERQ